MVSHMVVNREGFSFQVLACTANILVAVLAMLSGSHNVEASLLLLLAFLIASSSYTALIGYKGFSPLSYSAFLFYTYGFVLPGLFVSRTNAFYWPSSALTESGIFDASVITLVATAMLSLGRFTSLGRREKKYRMSLADRNTRAVLLLTGKHRYAMVVVILFATMYILFAVLSFGIGLFWGTRASVGFHASHMGLNSTTIGLVKLASQSLALSSLVLSAYFKFRVGISSRLLTLCFIVSLLLVLLVNNPLFTPRYWMVATITVVLLTVFHKLIDRFKGLLYFLSPIFMFLVFPFLGAMNRRGDELSFQFNFISPIDFMTHGDLDGFQSITNAVKLVSESGFAYGGRILSALLFFVPRSIWSGKYQSTGTDAAIVSDYHFTRISMPLPGELYSDGGLVAVVLGMFCVGISIRKLDDLYDKPNWNTQVSYLKVLICVVMAGFAPILLRGSLLSVISGAFVASFFFVVWASLSNIRIGGKK